MPQLPAPPMPAGQTDKKAWEEAWVKGWIVDARLPLTQVIYDQKVRLTAPCDPVLTHEMTGRMLAFPLTKNGPPGSAPKGTSTWWSRYFNSASTGHATRSWVQGHLLNDNVHGPGDPQNLLPITYALNGTMEKWAESVIKANVERGKILGYEVTAQWSCGARVGSTGNSNAQAHPQAMHDAYSNLRRGECLAPTSLSWCAWELQWNGQSWTKTPLAFNGVAGVENNLFPNSWND